MTPGRDDKVAPPCPTADVRSTERESTVRSDKTLGLAAVREQFPLTNSGQARCSDRSPGKSSRCRQLSPWRRLAQIVMSSSPRGASNRLDPAALCAPEARPRREVPSGGPAGRAIAEHSPPSVVRTQPAGFRGVRQACDERRGWPTVAWSSRSPSIASPTS